MKCRHFIYLSDDICTFLPTDMPPKRTEASCLSSERKKLFSLSKLSDEEIRQMMASIASDESEEDNDSSGDFDDDDSIADPDFQVSSEKDAEIEECMSELGRPSPTEPLFHPSPPPMPSDSLIAAQAVEMQLEETQNGPLMPSASTVTHIKLKPRKRARSPLPEQEEYGPSGGPNDGGFNGDVMQVIPKSKEFASIVWKKRHLQLHRNEVVFQGEKRLPESYNDLKTPFQCFTYFFTDELFAIISRETNLHARQMDIQTKFTITPVQIRQYVGILVYMSLYRYPSVEKYWGRNAFQAVKSAMTSKQFYTIRKYLRFNNIELMKKRIEEGYDPLFKIRPVVNFLNARFDSVPKQPRLCVDEQMCATKMRSRFRQYMPKKPHKWGMKLFVLCDSTGFSYKFEIYHGAGDNTILPNTPDMGATSNVVARLSQTIPDFKNHILYFDNFYTSLQLLVYLRSRGIFSLGTVRSNRISNCKLPSDKDQDLTKKDRGYSTEYVGSAFGVDISTVLWKDTKIVRLASTYAGVLPFHTTNPESRSAKVVRYDRKNKEFIEVDCPNVIKEYNCHMGGVDLMDGLLGRYHIRLKTKSASLRIFYHLIDMAMVNSYLLHRRIHGKIFELPEFREEVAEVLCHFQQPIEKKSVGRPSLNAQDAKAKIGTSGGKKTYVPPPDVRYDGVGHMADFLDRTGKRMCKFPGCKSETQVICLKCDLNLCLSATRKCFHTFHTK